MAHERKFGGLVCHIYGNGAPTTLYVFVHGDQRVVTGMEWAQALVASSGGTPVRAVALIRPGYDDRTGERPENDDGYVVDQYTQHNIFRIGTAIQEMKNTWHSARTIGIGFSGGAACMGVLLGLRPGTVDHAVLVSGPYDLLRWRAERRRMAYPHSLSAVDYIGSIPRSTKIRCIHGTLDRTISVKIGEDYVQRLRSAGLDATFTALERTYHATTASLSRLCEATIKAARALG